MLPLYQEIKTITNIMEKLTIKLSNTSLRKLILEQMILAESFGWTGWRVPIYLDNIEKDDVGEREYTFSVGSWVSDHSCKSDALEIYKVERWEIDEDGLEEGSDMGDLVASQVNYLLDKCWYDLIKGVEEIIYTFFYNYEQKEVEIIWE